MLLCLEETRLTLDVHDAEGPFAGSLGKSGIFKVVSTVRDRSWCRGEVRVSPAKPEYNDTVVSKAPKCSGATESGQGGTPLLSSIVASSRGDCTLFSIASSVGWSLSVVECKYIYSIKVLKY